MPIYEYACDDCGHKFEALQKMSDDPLKQCPACNQFSLRKLVSAPNFELKGTGWYETDFKHKKKPDAGAAGGDKSDDVTSGDKKANDGKSSDGKSSDQKSDAQPPAVEKKTAGS